MAGVVQDAILDCMSANSKRQYKRYKEMYLEFANGRVDCPELLAEFAASMLQRKYRASTVTVATSVVRKFLRLERRVSFPLGDLTSELLRVKRKTEVVKSACAFDPSSIAAYIRNLSNDPDWLCRKLLLLFGVLGGFRAGELCSLTFGDVKVHGEGLVVHTRKSKVDQAGRGMIRLIPCMKDPSIDPVRIFKEYLEYVGAGPDTRLFLQCRGGSYTKQPLGVHSISAIVRDVAKVTDPGQWEKFRGHSLRATMATGLVNASGTDAELQRHGGWAKPDVASHYVKDSISGEILVGKKLRKMMGSSEDGTTVGCDIDPVGKDLRKTVIMQNCLLRDCSIGK